MPWWEESQNKLWSHSFLFSLSFFLTIRGLLVLQIPEGNLKQQTIVMEMKRTLGETYDIDAITDGI